ncbi:MAG: hypothetical protein QME74_02690 [Candidatus Edwardsbacteria bacterium]|nr:hypothetical protein [Candidatus Edwardsbacteria bacterium]
MEYRIFNIKAGYLALEIKQGRALIRTFLFITSDGTPEGDRLRQVCGLGRLDKHFLALDRLSTFVAADFSGHAKLRELFAEAGLECLWELKEKIGPLCYARGQESAAALMEHYLGLDQAAGKKRINSFDRD